MLRQGHIAKQRKSGSVVVTVMTYAFLSISREEDGRQVVRAPRKTDALGYALRGAFGDSVSMPADMARLLERLDAKTDRPH